jgi:predicted dehydrogenase
MTYRIGLVGAGAVADLHAAAITAHPAASLAAVCDLDLDRARSVDPGASHYTDFAAMLCQVRLDAVVINTPHALHLPMCRQALDAGVDVLVEKPLATNPEDCSAIIDAAAAAGRVLAVGQIQHFMPEKLAIAAVLEEGTLGPVIAIHDHRSTDYRPGHRSGWFFDRAISGGGALMNIGGHCLDRSLWLAGSSAVQVSARFSHRFGSPVETDAQLLIDLESGVDLVISVRSDQPRHVDEITVVCEDGTLIAAARQGAWLRQDGRTTQLHATARDDIPTAFRQQLDDFIDALEGAQPRVNPSHALHIVEVITAAYRAADGEPIPIRSAATTAIRPTAS